MRISSERLFLFIFKDREIFSNVGRARVLVHADPDELGHVGLMPGLMSSLSLGGYPHAGLHGGRRSE